MRSLHARLCVALVVILVFVGVASVVSTLETTRLHRTEAEQRLHRELAARIVTMKTDRLLDAEGELQTSDLGELFHWLMVVNPRLELYLLDPTGRLLAWEAPPGIVQLDRVDLDPVRRFLSGAELPLVGDDPRHPERSVVFSAAAVGEQTAPVGYLYVVLDGREARSIRERLSESSILRMSLLGGLGVLFLAALAWSILAWTLTRPLHRLRTRMANLGTTLPDVVVQDSQGGELRALEATFEEMARRIEDQVAEIRRIEGLRRELVANVSHDLRTPLAALRGYLDTLVLKTGAPGPGERDEYLRTALRHAERLSRLLDELFQLTRLDAREVELHIERFSLAELVQDNVARFRFRAEERGVHLDAELQRDVAPVEADLGLIERVLENLVENALRHTPTAGSVKVSLRAAPGGVEVAVSDTGSGIPREELPRLFERWQAGAGGGTGLGLAIAQRILELHRSQIAVESEPGTGSTFSFRLAAA